MKKKNRKNRRQKITEEQKQKQELSPEIKNLQN